MYFGSPGVAGYLCITTQKCFFFKTACGGSGTNSGHMGVSEKFANPWQLRVGAAVLTVVIWEFLKNLLIHGNLFMLV